MRTLEIAYTAFADRAAQGNSQRWHKYSVYNEVRKQVRDMNRVPTRIVNIRVMNKPGAIVEENGRKFLITTKGRRLPI